MKQIENTFELKNRIEQDGLDGDHYKVFDSVISNKNFYTLIFAKFENKNYILFCTFYLSRTPFERFPYDINRAYETEKSEGNKLYTEIKQTRFISKNGKVLYKSSKI